MPGRSAHFLNKAKADCIDGRLLGPGKLWLEQLPVLCLRSCCVGALPVAWMWASPTAAPLPPPPPPQKGGRTHAGSQQVSPSSSVQKAGCPLCGASWNEGSRLKPAQ